MPRKAPKMTELVIEETSGVDHPAHLHEGWLVMKTANPETVADVQRNLPEPMEALMDKTTEVVEELKAEDVPEEKMDEEMKDAEEDLAVATARITELEARIAELEAMASDDMPDAEEEMMDGEEMLDEETLALAKSSTPDVRTAIVKMARETAVAKQALATEREAHADAEATVKAKSAYSHLAVDAGKIGPALRRLAGIDSDLAKSVEDALAAADAQNESADIFSEVGKGFTIKGDAIDKISSLAKAAVAEGKFATIEQAYAQVATENPALYNDYLIEKGA
jgi:hypothetical protein